MKARSPETELRYVKADLKREHEKFVEADRSRGILILKLQDAVRERDEWKARFDELLRRMPEVPR